MGSRPCPCRRGRCWTWWQSRRSRSWRRGRTWGGRPSWTPRRTSRRSRSSVLQKIIQFGIRIGYLNLSPKEITKWCLNGSWIANCTRYLIRVSPQRGVSPAASGRAVPRQRTPRRHAGTSRSWTWLEMWFFSFGKLVFENKLSTLLLTYWMLNVGCCANRSKKYHKTEHSKSILLNTNSKYDMSILECSYLWPVLSHHWICPHLDLPGGLADECGGVLLGRHGHRAHPAAGVGPRAVGVLRISGLERDQFEVW